MIKCDVCGSIFFSIEGLPGEDGRSFDAHLPFCNAKARKAKAKKYKKREREVPGKDAEWKDFD